MRKFSFCILLFAVSVLFGMSVGAESVSLLKDLDVANGYMIQFDKDTPFYTVELDEGEGLPQIIAVPKSEDCTIKIDGADKKIYPGTEETVTVSVSDTKGNFATYTLKVYARSEKGGLEFLRCLNGTMSPQYRDSARNFYIILPNECTEAELDIRTIDKNAHVSVTGNENLPEGKRKRVVMTITDSNGTAYEYALFIYREAKVSSNINRSFLLSGIQINGGLVPIDFEQTKGYYRICVPDEHKKLTVKALAEERNNIVEISGTDTVADAEHNIMTITVSDPDDETLGKSIYVLDFFRSSYVTTPVFSAFQATVLISVSVFFTVAVLAAVYVLVIRKKKKAADNTDIKAEVSEKEDTPVASEKDLSGRC